MAVGGGSADRKADELVESGDPSAGAWAAGAAGERRVANELAGLSEAWTVIHDRLLSPGLSAVNLDHVVVGPGGAYFIDAKNWRGAITPWEGGLFQHTGTPESRQSVSKHQEVAKVHGMAAYMAAESGIPISPVIALAGQHEAEFGAPQPIRGVWVVAASDLAQWLRARPTVLQREAVERASITLMTSFPSTTTDPQLLQAMGAASAAAKPSSRPNPRARRSQNISVAGEKSLPAGTKTRPQRGLFRRLLRGVLVLVMALGLFAAALAFVPRVLTELTTRATGSGAPSEPVETLNCASVTPAQVSKIVGRTVQPVAVREGCAWGTRLDDPKTIVVELWMPPDATRYRTQLRASTEQKRVVYGAGVDQAFQRATGLWVAVGQPVPTGRSSKPARESMHVLLASKAMNVTDDRARTMSLAIAQLANADLSSAVEPTGSPTP